MVSVIWFALACANISLNYNVFFSSLTPYNNIRRLVEEYQDIERRKLSLEKLISDYYEEKIQKHNIRDPERIQVLKSKTLWTLTIKKREKILNRHFYTMREDGDTDTPENA